MLTVEYSKCFSQGILSLADRLYLVSCVAKKGEHPAPARDLYLSTWFVLARDWIERDGAPWYILSSKYGLVHPDTVISPYDKTLNAMGVNDRRDWAANVENQMDEMMSEYNEVIVFAGQRYHEYLEDYLRHRFNSMKVPMKGLRIGQQLRWLKHGPD